MRETQGRGTDERGVEVQCTRKSYLGGVVLGSGVRSPGVETVGPVVCEFRTREAEKNDFLRSKG